MSDEPPKRTIAAADIGAALALLTRLPLAVDHAAVGARGARAAWAYPLAGAILGVLLGLAGGLLHWLGADAGITAAVLLALAALVTGAMHEDGLADCADGIGGGASREERLEIMKDSRIGAFGAVALVLALIARWASLATLAANGTLFGPLIATAAISRLPMVAAMAWMTNARGAGLSAAVGRPPARTLAVAALVAFTVAVATMGAGGLVVLFWALVAPLPLGFLAQNRLGGQTGDVLGGMQQLAEIAALAAAVAVTA